MARNVELSRKTAETDIWLKLEVDGSGRSAVNTGTGFFDHMLTLLSKHGLMDLEIKAEGDLEVDASHGRRRGYRFRTSTQTGAG